MKTPTPVVINETTLFVWLMHRIAEEFRDHAILKGGMELRLLDCPRLTNDLDYIFVPYTLKREIAPSLMKIVREIPGAEVNLAYHSTSFRITIKHPSVSLQIESNVATECKSTVVTTQSLARLANVQPRPIRVMSFDYALAHKLAAWNERRLARDLYDIYFLFQVQNQMPNRDILKQRLAKIHSRIPRLKKTRSMTFNEFADALEAGVGHMTQKDLERELQGVLIAEDLKNLLPRLKTTIHRLAANLRHSASQVR